MTTLSVREIAERHLDKTGDLSVNADVYGYIHRDSQSRLFGKLEAPDDVLPGFGTAAAPTTRSLRQQLETVAGKSVDLILLLVGHEPDFSGEVTLGQVVKLQYALQVARDLYAQVDLGIRRLVWGRIPVADMGGFADIRTFSKAIELTMRFTGLAGAIDLFVVQTMGGKVGRSPRNGPCNKRSVIVMTGVVIEFEGSPQMVGIRVAHEVGHYLGLGHESDSTNLMCGPKLFHERCDPSVDMTNITADQAETMNEHCMINPG
jgi:hypothetical protein